MRRSIRPTRSAHTSGPRFRRSRRWELIVGVVLALLALLRGWGPRDEQGSGPVPVQVGGLKPGEYQVERVVDGDTLLLSAGHTRVRLQGIDTPETVKEDSPVEPWGPEASAFAKDFIAAAGGRVRIEVDGEPRDQHGRYLAFVWHGDRMLNEELLRAGLARARLQYDYGSAKKSRFRRAQRDAQQAARGIWSAKPAVNR